jgi:MATE family multidrug resistance protein
LAGWGLSSAYGNRGLWCAFILFVVARALTLGAYYPSLRRSLVQPSESASS